MNTNLPPNLSAERLSFYRRHGDKVGMICPGCEAVTREDRSVVHSSDCWIVRKDYPCRHCGCDMGVEYPEHRDTCPDKAAAVPSPPPEELVGISEFPTLTISLLPGTEAYAADIKSFFDLMVWKLFKNGKKGYWGDADIQKYTTLLEGEYRELLEALPSGNIAWIMEENADVANMALIIASATMRKATVK